MCIRDSIGTSSPGYSLDVLDNSGVSGVRIRNTNNTEMAAVELWNNIGQAGFLLTTGSNYALPAYANIFGLVSSGTRNLVLGAINNGNISLITNLNEKMKITTDGKIGIGTSNPESKLHVHGGNITLTNSTATEQNYIKFGRGGYMYDNGTALILGHD